jgi:hypothetical protein
VAKKLYAFNNKGIVLDMQSLAKKFIAAGGTWKGALKTDSKGALMEKVPYVEEGACFGAVIGWFKHALVDGKPVQAAFDHNTVNTDQSLFKYVACRRLLEGKPDQEAKEAAFRVVFEYRSLAVGPYEEVDLTSLGLMVDAGSFHHISIDIARLGAHSMGLHLPDDTRIMLFEPSTGLWEFTNFADFEGWLRKELHLPENVTWRMAPVTK